MNSGQRKDRPDAGPALRLAGKDRPDGGAPLKLAKGSLTWREVDGEIVVLDRRSWMYISVNDSGVLLWKEIIDGASPSRLVECLRDAYEIDAEVARRDVEAFLEALSSHNLLVEDGAG